MTFYNFLLWQAWEIISLLKQLWPEGSDIRRVLCVTSCSLTLRVYHDFLENREKTTSGQETNIQQVGLVLFYCETPLRSTFEILLTFIYHFFHLVFIYSLIYLYTLPKKKKKGKKSRFRLLKNTHFVTIRFSVLLCRCFPCYLFNQICPTIQRKGKWKRKLVLGESL